MAEIISLSDRYVISTHPFFRTMCNSLLRHASHQKIVVRIENYRAIKKLMLATRPGHVLNHMFDHIR